MSGSPIIQNGKLIGAVTHVFVQQDSTMGYGIFIENMLNQVESSDLVENSVELVLQNILDSAFSRGYNKRVAF